MTESIQRTIPNFFIIGAPKCGTTALSEYLREHPRIFMSHPKEPHYFSTDFPNHRTVTTEEEYLRLFRKAGTEHLAVGEASVWYLYSEEAVRNIHRFNSEARLIVMLRNPVEMLPSLHSQGRFSLEEDAESLEEAWELQTERREGRHIPKLTRTPALLQYAHAARFGEQMERTYGIFPREQVKVILFDDFIKDTKTVYDDVLQFLGVPSNGRTDFPPVNVGKTYRWEWLTKFIYKPGPRMIRFKTRVREMLGVDRLWLWEALKRLNAKKEQRQPMTPEFRAKLVEEFRPDIGKLSSLIGRDLSHWLNGKEQGS
jgi:hypothetical protein